MEEWMIGAAVAVSGYALNYGAKAYNLLRPRPTAITETENNPDMKSPKSLETCPENNQTALKMTSTPTKTSKPGSKLTTNEQNPNFTDSNLTDSNFDSKNESFSVQNFSVLESSLLQSNNTHNFEDSDDFENKVETSKNLSKLRRSESLLNRSRPNISTLKKDRIRDTNNLDTSRLNLPLRNHNLTSLATQKKRHFSSSSSICSNMSYNPSILNRSVVSSIAPSVSMNSFIGKKKQRITGKNLDDFLAKNKIKNLTQESDENICSSSKKRSAKQLDTSINNSFAIPTHIPIRPQGKKSKQVSSPENLIQNAPKASSPNKNQQDQEFSDSKSEIIKISKTRSKLTLEQNSGPDLMKLKRKGSSECDLDISNVDIDESQSEISMNQSITSVSTNRSYRPSKSIRAHLVDRYAKQNSSPNRQKSTSKLNPKLLSPEREMSPAKLAFQKKFNSKLVKGSPSSPKSQKNKMPKFDEKWMSEMEEKSTLSNSPLFAPRSDNEKKKFDVSETLKKSVQDKHKKVEVKKEEMNERARRKSVTIDTDKNQVKEISPNPTPGGTPTNENAVLDKNIVTPIEKLEKSPTIDFKKLDGADKQKTNLSFGDSVKKSEDTKKLDFTFASKPAETPPSSGFSFGTSKQPTTAPSTVSSTPKSTPSVTPGPTPNLTPSSTPKLNMSSTPKVASSAENLPVLKPSPSFNFNAAKSENKSETSKTVTNSSGFGDITKPQNFLNFDNAKKSIDPPTKPVQNTTSGFSFGKISDTKPTVLPHPNAATEKSAVVNVSQPSTSNMFSQETSQKPSPDVKSVTTKSSFTGFGTPTDGNKGLPDVKTDTKQGGGLFGLVKQSTSQPSIFGGEKPSSEKPKTSMFGGQTTEKTTPSPFGGSGDSKTTVFGGQTTEKPKTGMFGVKPTSETEKTGMFGLAQSSEKPKTSVFGAKNTEQQKTSMFGGAGDSKSNMFGSSGEKTTLFGNNAMNKTGAAASSGSGVFSNLSSNINTESGSKPNIFQNAPSSGASTGIFGNKSGMPSTSSTNNLNSNSAFNQTTTPQNTESNNSGFQFGSTTQNQNQTQSSPFNPSTPTINSQQPPINSQATTMFASQNTNTANTFSPVSSQASTTASPATAARKKLKPRTRRR